MLAGRVLEYIRKHRLMQPGDRVAAAVSGGADSVGLLRVLLELRSELGIVLGVAHFNHQIRGADSDGDASFVAGMAQKFDLEFHSATGDATAHTKIQHVSLETAARELRYQFFRSLLEAGQVNRIATGHTLDDQAETLMMKLVRGAGTKGLAGIHPVLKMGSGAIVRPLLAAGRNEIEVYLRSAAQEWREDASNLHLHHTRNRVRHELIPLMERSFNPAIRHTLAETAEIARAEEEYWSRVIAELLPAVFDPHTGWLQAERLMQHPVAIQRRLLRAAAARVGIMLEFKQVEELRTLIEAPPGPRSKAHDLPGGRAILQQKSGSVGLELRFQQQCQSQVVAAKDQSNDYEYQLAWPGEVKVVETGTTFRVRLVAARGKPDSDSKGSQLLRPGLLQSELRVRNWRAGDRYWPAHTASPKKLKELLQQVPLAERRQWPVIVSGEEIIWVRGLRAPARLLLSAEEQANAAGVQIEELAFE